MRAGSRCCGTCSSSSAGASPRDETLPGAFVTETPVCVFDLDHTLVSSPLDLRAVGREMEAFVRRHGVTLPPRDQRSSAPELFDLVRRDAAHLAGEVLAIPVAHERRAMEQ